MNLKDLNTYIKEQLNGCSGYAFIDRFLAEFNELVKKHKTFSCDKFVEWFNSRNVVYKTAPISFLKKCGFEDIESGKFDANSEEVVGLNSQSLFNALRNANITLYNDERGTIYIDVVEKYIIRNGLMTLEELICWNHKAVAYLANKGKTSEDFIKLFKASKAMKELNLPFLELEVEVKKNAQEWEELLSKVGENEVSIDYNSMTPEDVKKFIEESETKNE